MFPLPIDDFIPQICEQARSHAVTLIHAAPGSGKTTRVPPALLKTIGGQVVVLEPRRLAAKLSAQRVAEEMGEDCGRTTGYQMRFEKKISAATRLRFLTEGMFLRLLMEDRSLGNITCLVLDEFHERHLHTDVAFALARQLQSSVRPDLRLVIMSATLDLQSLRASIPGSGWVSLDQALYPVEVEYRAPDRRYPQQLEGQVRAAVTQLLADRRSPGHLLVFLPGVGEIRRCADALQDVEAAGGCTVIQLYADAPPEQQRQAFAQSGRRKIILSTNVAETSVTIDGVTGIVDSGLARIAGHDAWSGLPTLEVRPVSKSSCLQRAGRAGRTTAGVAVRLFSQHDFAGRPDAEAPEIRRLDLAETLLHLFAVLDAFPDGASPRDPEHLPWLDPPPVNALEGARGILRMLGALDEGNRLTAIGRRMAGWPLHPRLSRTIVEAERLSVGPQALLSAVLLNEGTVVRRDYEADAVAASDVSHQAELLAAVARNRRAATALDPYQSRRVERVALALGRSFGRRMEDMLRPADENALAAALLAGFADRVAAVRKAAGRDRRIELLMCDGTSAVLSPASVVRDSRFLIALEAEQSRAPGPASATTRIRMACGLEPDVLAACGGERLREEAEYYWDAAAKRARGVQRLRYGALILEEKQATGREAELEPVLVRALREDWPQPFGKDGEAALRSLSVRAAFLGPEAGLPDFADTDFDRLLEHISKGKQSFAEIAKRDLEDYIMDLIPPGLRRELAESAPERVTLASGRKVKVNYEPGKQPWIAAPLQEFYGTTKTPRIGRSRLAVVVHLLAPNGRAVQVTNDLQSFWTVHYPKLRNALSRRYPKHRWP